MSHLQYSLISTNPKSKKEINLYNKAYELWESQWRPLLKEKFKADDFFRQDYISVYTEDLNIVAIHLYTLFDQSLKSVKDHSYFSDFPKNFLELMDKEEIQTMASCESLTVHPNYRKSKTAQHLAPIIFQITGELSSHLGVDALIGPCMTVNFVNKLATSAGGITLAKDISYKNLNCDIVYFKPGNKIEPKEPELLNMYKELWNNRNDFTGVTEGNRKKQAA